MSGDAIGWLQPPPELRQVIAVGRDLGLRDGARTVVTSVEVWSRWLTVHYLQVPPPDFEDPLREWESMQVTDDVGTAYELRSGTGGGDDQVWRAHRSWQPAPPEEASRLVVTIAGVEVSIDLG